MDRIADCFGRLNGLDAAPDLVVFPETATTGYFLEGGVREHAVTTGQMLDRLAEAWARAPGSVRAIDAVIGFYEKHDNLIYNSALYAELGPDGPRLRHVHRKVFLPTYGVFQEERFVEPGSEIAAFDTRWGRAAMLICEDLWHSVSATMAARDGAHLLIVPSASPARGTAPGSGLPGNVERWEQLACGAASAHGLAVAVCQLVGFEGGKGFAGGSFACEPGGGTLHRSVLWDEALDVVRFDLETTTERPIEAGARDQSDLRRELSPVLRRREANEEARERGRSRDAEPDARACDPDLLDIDASLVEDWLVRFLVEEMHLRRGFKHAVIGLSGGVDSAVTAALCARALGPENVTGFLMPYRTSSTESIDHAMLVADQLGIGTRTIEITGAVDGYLTEFEAEADPRRRGNVMARTRMIVLFDQAAKLGALPVGTGNKSERLLGYFTWHADDSPPINPLGDLFKTQVWALARHLGLPDAVIDKPASADLVVGQTDEDDLGVAYTEADLILLQLIEGRTPEWLNMAGFAPGSVATVRNRLESTHWKRNLPTVAMLSSTAIGEWYLRPVDY
ncbi:MAG: NAD+ synthase [Gemmatimonadetes bacterium]|nr:MAG: NAD+ synthase [Gemmatimonadota bacterium]